MAKIFVCYAHEDRDTVRPISLLLRAVGHNAWMDEDSLAPGSVIKPAIRKAIEDSDFFVACLSAHSVNKRGFVQRELKMALDVLEEFPEDAIFVVPLRLDNCTVPDSLKSRAWIDMFEPGAKMRLLRAFTGSDPVDEDSVHEAIEKADLFSPKHNKGRVAFRDRRDYADAERLAREAYDEIPNPHSRLNEQVARYFQGTITKHDLDRWVYRLHLEDGGHGKSVLAKGY